MVAPGSRAVYLQPAVVVEALGVDQKVLAEVVAGGQQVDASEAAVVLELDLSLEHYEESAVAQAVELHFVEAELVFA